MNVPVCVCVKPRSHKNYNGCNTTTKHLTVVFEVSVGCVRCVCVLGVCVGDIS